MDNRNVTKTKGLLKDISEYQEYHKLAASIKSDIVTTYEKVMSYTYTTGIASTQKADEFYKRNINSDIAESVNSLKNFVMWALFGVKAKWASAAFLKEKIRKKYGGTPEAIKNVEERLKENFNNVNDEIFTYIMSSNYEKEIGRAMQDWGELGTGCYEIIEQSSDKTPFLYRYVPINELEFTEDDTGMPSIVFRHRFAIPIEFLKIRYKGIDLSEYQVNPENKLDKVHVVECVMPTDDGKFEFIVFNQSLDNVLWRTVRNYNPYNVFRFSLVPNSCWGVGVGVLCLDTYERICYYENLRARQVARIVEPPMAAIGDKKYMVNFDPSPNAMNWLGDGTQATNIFPVNTTGNLLPTETDIQRFVSTIQALHFNQPFGSAENKTTRATQEIEYRMSLMQQRFSDAVSNLYSEVLVPAYETPKQILLDKGKIQKIDEEEFIKIIFINNLTKSVNYQKIQDMINAKAAAQQLVPMSSQFMYNPDTTIELLRDNFDIAPDVIQPKEAREQQEAQSVQNSLLANSLNETSEQGGGML